MRWRIVRYRYCERTGISRRGDSGRDRFGHLEELAAVGEGLAARRGWGLDEYAFRGSLNPEMKFIALAIGWR